MNILVYILFALSGFAGLIYEGSWARYLKLFLGHSSYGQVLTLCIYMGGLAIGSFVAGKLVEKIKRPLLGYAAVELAIGIGGVAYHPLYNWLTGIFYDSSFVAGLSSRGAEVVKVVLATGSTLPIAIAVGMATEAGIDDDGATDGLSGRFQQLTTTVDHVGNLLYGRNVLGVLGEIEEFRQQKVFREFDLFH